MASNRIGRINEEIQRELSDLIVLEESRENEAMKGLRSAGGWLRRELGQKLQLRYTPELVFELDDSLKYGAHMYDLLSRLSAQEKREEPEHDDNT